MPLEVTHHRMTANGLDQRYVVAGKGPPTVQRSSGTTAAPG